MGVKIREFKLGLRLHCVNHLAKSAGVNLSQRLRTCQKPFRYVALSQELQAVASLLGWFACCTQQSRVFQDTRVENGTVWL